MSSCLEIKYFNPTGTDELWPVLLALPVVTSFAGAFLLFTFFPETPSSLLSKFKDVEELKIH